MRYIILGTAGHIDHGKSALVKALTGTDPDRLKEEKERGITIDLGFANMDFPDDDLTIGIVDVPGHERLVKNMLAGAGGIDLVVLVIAADEGIMPQSREHLEICNLLKIKAGLVAITKMDLVEPDWLELVTSEAEDFVRGTFLEGAPVIPISSKTGENLDTLKEQIKEVSLTTEPKPEKGLFRLPIDRVFTLKGFGTVVTGTAISGAAKVDEQLEVLPSGIKCKIRGIHSHGKALREAHAGQRAALNLQGVEKDDIHRGDTIVPPGRFTPTRAVDTELELLADAPPLKNRSLVHFYLGTSETVARLVLYGTNELKPGETRFCQLRLQDPVVAQNGDRYIIRRFSPLVTIGGGSVLNPYPPRRRRRKDGTEDLLVLKDGTLDEKIAAFVQQAALTGTNRAAVEGWIREELPLIAKSIKLLKEKGTLTEIEGTLVHKAPIEALKETIVKELTAFHKKNPLKQGIAKEEVRTRLRIEPRLFNGLLGALKEVAAQGEFLRLSSFKAALSGEEGGLKKQILDILKSKKFQPSTRDELAKTLTTDPRRIADILKLMAEEGSVVRIIDTIYISREDFDDLISRLRDFFAKKPEMAVSEFRDLLGTTRKYALPFLEYLDSNKVTFRVGDIRKCLLK